MLPLLCETCPTRSGDICTLLHAPVLDADPHGCPLYAALLVRWGWQPYPEEWVRKFEELLKR